MILRTVDLYLVTWGSPHIAQHGQLSVFQQRRYICLSIETRKQRGQGYSAVKGMFRSSR